MLFDYRTVKTVAKAIESKKKIYTMINKTNTKIVYVNFLLTVRLYSLVFIVIKFIVNLSIVSINIFRFF